MEGAVTRSRWRACLRKHRVECRYIVVVFVAGWLQFTVTARARRRHAHPNKCDEEPAFSSRLYCQDNFPQARARKSRRRFRVHKVSWAGVSVGVGGGRGGGGHVLKFPTIFLLFFQMTVLRLDQNRNSPVRKSGLMYLIFKCKKSVFF